MKRYLIFGNEDYYPHGGWEDFKFDADELPTAEVVAEQIPDEYARQWWHIVDTQTGEIVGHHERIWG